eukprot:gene15925-biopygen5309
MDGFKVSSSTFLCEKHFTSADIKRNPNHWRLVPGAVPSLNLVAGTVPSTGGKRKARKPPSARFEIFPSSSQDTSSQFSSFGGEIDAELGSPFEEDLSTSTVSISTQTDFSFVNSPTYLPIDFEKMENDIMDSFIKSDTLQSQIQELSAKVIKLENQVEQLELKLAQVKLSLLSIEKLKSDSSATKFYTGFPNFPTLMSTFEYFEPKVLQMQYWRGNKSSQSSDDYHTKSSRGPKRFLTHLEEFILVLMRLKVGVLALLEDGDNLMADRGFDVKDILPPGVTLNIPPFKGTRAQLTANETEETARIASVRIHVERAIGRETLQDRKVRQPNESRREISDLCVNNGEDYRVQVSSNSRVDL